MGRKFSIKLKIRRSTLYTEVRNSMTLQVINRFFVFNFNCCILLIPKILISLKFLMAKLYMCDLL